jgi:hypothetical protein
LRARQPLIFFGSALTIRQGCQFRSHPLHTLLNTTMAARRKEEKIMTDAPGNVRALRTLNGVEGPRTITVPFDKLVIDETAVDEELVAKLMESMEALDQINPITARAQKLEDGGLEYRVVAGLHRAVAQKRLGRRFIQCTLLDCEDTLRLEQVSIDENIIRKKLGASERAMLWGRRSKILKERGERDGTLSQIATASKQSQRADGLETGPDFGSMRNQSKQTGASKDEIYKSMKRFETLGPAILKSIVGTSLNKGVELDALAQLPDQLRDDLVKRAVAGEVVSAKRVNHKSRLQHDSKAKREPQRQISKPEQAWIELNASMAKCSDLLVAHGLSEKIEEFLREVYEAFWPSDEEDDPEQASERPKKIKWWPWGREGD